MNIKICIHWTGGRNDNVNSREKDSYHFIVTKKGIVHPGKHRPEKNFKRLTNRDIYAAHCGGGNSFTIGVAVAGGPRGYTIKGENHEFSRKSFEEMCNLIAELAHKYKIPITPERIYTHYEFGTRNQGTDSVHKTDITSFPWLLEAVEKSYTRNTYGDEIRKKIRWYYNRLYM
jgi:hypothetical protein